MEIYLYNQETLEFLEKKTAHLDPIESSPLIPLNGTLTPVPEFGENQKPVIVEGPLEERKNWKWSIVPDFRGVDYYHKNTKEQKRFKLGEGKQPDWVDKAPTAFDEVWEESENKWILPFSAKQARKNGELSLSMVEYLAGGLVVSAGFKIDSKQSDASFLSAAYENHKLSGATTIQFCDFDNVVHELTTAQFETVLSELGNHIQAAFAKKWSLREQVNNAKTEDELNLIKW